MAASLDITPRSVFPFQDLPGEIRNKIYNLLLVQEDPIRLKEEIYPKPERAGWSVSWMTNYGLSSSIFRASKQLAAESLPVLYSNNTFILDSNNYPALWGPGGQLCRYNEVISRISVSAFDRGIYEWRQTREEWLPEDEYYYFVDRQLENAANLVAHLKIFTGLKYLKIDFAYDPVPPDIKTEVVQEIINLGRELPTAILEIDGLKREELKRDELEIDVDDEDWQIYLTELQEMRELETYIMSS